MSRVAIVERVIDVSSLIAEVAAPSCGATSVFLGSVRETNDGREVSGIEYSAYAAMAERELERIVAEAAARFDVNRLVVEHRVGTLDVGDVSVAIVAAHAHRAQTLDATRYVIEELKRRVPIWKREHYLDGTRQWIDPTASPHPVSATAETLGSEHPDRPATEANR
jgi:molybdopterin synthase catalytic subunit